MIRIIQRLISNSIVTQKIAVTPKQHRSDYHANFYPVVGFKDIKLGSISLNQPNNQNFLTIEMINELFRFLTSYNHDHTIQNIWIENRGSMFLGGISYQELFKNPEYLDKLYKMIALLAKLNKPIFSCTTGGVRNVGAYVLSMASVILTDNSSTLRIDQVSKGFVPVAGGTHRLSRIPANIGFYLALTGKRLSSDEMSRLGFITGVVKQGARSDEIRKQITKSNLFFRSMLKPGYKDKRDSEYIQWGKILQKQKRLDKQIAINQQDIITNKDNVFAKFAMNQYRIAQINIQNAKKPFNSFSQKAGRQINNYFRLRHQKAFDYLQKQGLVEKSHFSNVRLPGIQIDKILRVFGQNTLVEAIKILQSDSSEWSKQALKNLRKMDPLAATLTFQMLKQAESLSWDQCLDLQYRVAKRLLASSELKLKESFDGSKFVLVNKYSDKKIQDVPLESVREEYLSPAVCEQQKLELQIQAKSLLPNVDYKDIPDSARLAMNQVFFNDVHINNQGIEMKRWLQQQKIDYRHKSYDIHVLREKILSKKEYQLVERNQAKRIEYLLNNSSIAEKYVSEKHSYVDQMSNETTSKLLDQYMKSSFNNGIKLRFEDFSTTAHTIGKEQKLQIFKNLRKVLIKKIVLQGIDLQTINDQRNESFNGLVYFDKKGKGIMESKNPYFQQNQPFNKLAQQIGTKMQLSNEFNENEGNFPCQKHLGVQYKLRRREKQLRKVQNKIQKRYDENPTYWNRAYEYKQLVKQAAKTSEEFAQYLEWDGNAFYSTILNSPSDNRIYTQVGEQIITKLNKSRTQQKDRVQTEIKLGQIYSEQYLDNLYKPHSHATHKSLKFLKDQILPKFASTKQIEKFIEPIFQQVMKHFQQKYFEEAFQDKKLQFGEFDKFIYENYDKSFLQVYKNDILFVYSYLTILKIKEILHNLKSKGSVQKNEDLILFFKQYHIEFHQDRTVKFMNRVISNLLFKLMDIHTYTKSKIVLPQTKLLDFLNRVKINRETNKKTMFPLSFESILLMIGKDRSKLYNKILNQYIPSQPQYLLEVARSSVYEYDNDLAGSDKNMSPSMYLFQNAVSQEQLQQKKLIEGCQYYLALFDSFIQRASGKYNFINDQTLALNPTQLKSKLGSILNLSQSNEAWFERVSREILKNFFNVRIQYEKSLTKGQLYAFDQQLKEILNPQTFKSLVKYYILSQIENTKQLFTNVRNYSFPINNSQKNEQMYCQIMRNVKNPEAFKRLNNLKLTMEIHRDYMRRQKDIPSTEQEKQDLAEEKKQFNQYERYPKQTYKRLVNDSLSYGEQKNFDKYLNPIKDREVDHKNIIKKLRFAEDERKTNTKKESKWTQFQDQIKSLKSKALKNNNNGEIESIYRKIEELI